MLYTVHIFILYNIYIQYIHLISVTLLQNKRIGNKFKKAKQSFFFVLPNENMLHNY